MPALRAPPANDDDREDLHSQVDNHTHLAASQFVTREATVRFAPAATVAIATSRGNRSFVLFEAFQD
jgi:hypothetical protein